jgi:hypothetical protein
MKRSFLIALVVVCGLVACGSSEEEAASTTTEAEGTVATAPATTTTPGATTPGTATPGTTAPATGAGPTATGGAGATISLSTGFTPDPTIATGTSGGAVEASTLSSDCAGWVSASPDHVLELGAAFPRLEIMAFGTEADSDVTLVVHRPDGSYLCNDDSDGFHPMVEGEMPAGRYEVFVGSYEQGRRQAYRLGVTTQENATPTQALSQATAQ